MTQRISDFRWPDGTRPAAIFHPSEAVADAAMARGWSLWDFAERIGALDTPMTVACWQFYAICDPDLIMDGDDPMDLERVFGISAEFWRRTEAAFRAASPDQRQSLSPEAVAWYDLSAPSTGGTTDA